MKFKPVKTHNDFVEEFSKVVYPQVLGDVGKLYTEDQSVNEDGTMSFAINEALRYGIELHNGREIDELSDEIAKLTLKDPINKSADYGFAMYVLAYFVPRGVKLFRKYHQKMGNKISKELNESIMIMEEQHALHDAELELEKAKRELEKFEKLEKARHKSENFEKSEKARHKSENFEKL